MPKLSYLVMLQGWDCRVASHAGSKPSRICTPSHVCHICYRLGMLAWALALTLYTSQHTSSWDSPLSSHLTLFLSSESVGGHWKPGKMGATLCAVGTVFQGKGFNDIACFSFFLLGAVKKPFVFTISPSSLTRRMRAFWCVILPFDALLEES